MKQYVLDTNILIESPDAIFGFDDNLVCITMKTLEELDGLKKIFRRHRIQCQKSDSEH